MSSIQRIANQHIGRQVVVHSRYGYHTGVLHHVDDNGMYLYRARAINMASGEQDAAAGLLQDGQQSLDVEEAWAPFFFIPWLWAWAVWPGAWWW